MHYIGQQLYCNRMAKFPYSFLMTTFVVVACSTGSQEKSDAVEMQQPTEQTVNDYPDLTFTLLDGETVSTRTLEGNNIFIFFQPDCRHCQIEAMNIEQRLEQFKGYNLYFVSSSSAGSIQAFAESFDLHDRKNVKFASASTESVLDHYGPIQTPSVYIYSNGKLKKSFNGETDIENILKAL
jgi:peroxiredoxin